MPRSSCHIFDMCDMFIKRYNNDMFMKGYDYGICIKRHNNYMFMKRYNYDMFRKRYDYDIYIWNLWNDTKDKSMICPWYNVTMRWYVNDMTCYDVMYWWYDKCYVVTRFVI